MWNMRHLFSLPHPWSRPSLAPSPGPVGDFLSPAASPGSSPGSGDTWELVGSPQSVVHSEIQSGRLPEVGFLHHHPWWSPLTPVSSAALFPDFRLI